MELSGSPQSLTGTRSPSPSPPLPLHPSTLEGKPGPWPVPHYPPHLFPGWILPQERGFGLGVRLAQRPFQHPILGTLNIAYISAVWSLFISAIKPLFMHIFATRSLCWKVEEGPPQGGHEGSLSQGLGRNPPERPSRHCQKSLGRSWVGVCLWVESWNPKPSQELVPHLFGYSFCWLVSLSFQLRAVDNVIHVGNSLHGKYLCSPLRASGQSMLDSRPDLWSGGLLAPPRP